MIRRRLGFITQRFLAYSFAGKVYLAVKFCQLGRIVVDILYLYGGYNRH